MFIDGVRNEYKKGNLAIVPKDTMYRTYSDTGMEFTFFHFDGDITVHEGSEPPVAYISPQKTKDPLYGTMERADRTVILDKKMLDNDAYCIDIMTQVEAVRAALNSFNKELLSDHLSTCVKENIKNGNDEVISELAAALQKLMK